MKLFEIHREIVKTRINLLHNSSIRPWQQREELNVLNCQFLCAIDFAVQSIV
jgi:hypothetical protein